MAFAAAILAMTGPAALGQTPSPSLPQPLALPVAPSNESPGSTEVRKQAKSQVQSQVVGMLGLITSPPATECVADGIPQLPVARVAPVVVQAASTDATSSRANAGGTAAPAQCPSESTACSTVPCETSVCEAETESSLGSLIIDIPLPGVSLPGGAVESPDTGLAPGTDESLLAPVISDVPDLQDGPSAPFVPAQPAASLKADASSDTSNVTQPAQNRAPQVVRNVNKMRLSINETKDNLPSRAAPSVTLNENTGIADTGNENIEFHLSDSPEAAADTMLLAEGTQLPTPGKHDPMQVRIEGQPTDKTEQCPNLSGVVGAPVPTFEPAQTELEDAESRARTDFAAQVVKRGGRQAVRMSTTDLVESSVQSAEPVSRSDFGGSLEHAPALERLPLSITDRIPASLVSQTQLVPSEPFRTPLDTITQVEAAVFGGVTKQGDAVALNPLQSSSIMTESAIVQCSAEHPAVCGLIKTGENTLSLIGLANGKTRIAIVTTGADGKPVVEIREVQVGKAERDQTGLRELAGVISQMVDSLYPNSRVEIVAQGQQLFVQGKVSSEDEARKILSLVRKTTLTPVIDRLQTDGQ